MNKGYLIEIKELFGIRFLYSTLKGGYGSWDFIKMLLGFLDLILDLSLLALFYPVNRFLYLFFLLIEELSKFLEFLLRLASYLCRLLS